MSSAEKKRLGDQLEARLGVYAGDVLKVVESISGSKHERHVADQLFRSATSAGANYAEARGAQSNNDFVHKLALAGKEMRESLFWVRLVETAGIAETNVSPMVEEADELIAMLTSALQTARDDGS
jgi:four helix bundle protein